VVAAAALSLTAGAVPASAAGGYIVTATIGVGTAPAGVAVNPATHTAYVANAGDNTVSVASAADPASGPIVSGYRANLCVADPGDSAANDTPVAIATCNASPSQNWTLTGTGTLQINGRCLDIYRDQKPTRPRSNSGPAPAAPTSNGNSPDRARRGARLTCCPLTPGPRPPTR
jgi:DNA-binding beta-propeller fold protein YncE